MSTDGTSRPPLDGTALSEAVTQSTPGWRVEVLDEAPSTNTVVSQRAAAGALEGLVVVTEHQTAGRGRLDRAWVTPPRAALTFSVLLRPRVPERRWTWVPLLTGLAVVEGIAAAGGPRCELKWPNDVVYAGRKLAGLLAELVATPVGPAVVTGVGLNVSTTAEELPVPTATSLALTGHDVPVRTELLAAVLAALAGRYEAWQEDAAALAEDYARSCGSLGRRVRAALPDGGVIEGTALAVDADGGLVVEGAAGRVSLSAADVVHLRPAG